MLSYAGALFLRYAAFWLRVIIHIGVTIFRALLTPCKIHVPEVHGTHRGRMPDVGTLICTDSDLSSPSAVGMIREKNCLLFGTTQKRLHQSD